MPVRGSNPLQIIDYCPQSSGPDEQASDQKSRLHIRKLSVQRNLNAGLAVGKSTTEQNAAFMVRKRFPE